MDGFAKGQTSEFAKKKLESAEAYTVAGPGLGPVNRATLVRDPKHLGFTLARYKFVSKMLTGHKNVFEIGCNEGTGTLVVAPEVSVMNAIDFTKNHIEFC